MSIIENANRIGHVTSSMIYRLMTNGKGPEGIGAPAVTYLDEINIERKMGRSISTEAYSKDLAWGKFLENRVFDMLGFEYELLSVDTMVHPKLPFWAGSCDLLVPGEKIGEIKCFQPKNFAQYTDALLEGDLDNLKKEFPKEYYQAVSNALINEVPKAELITYMPYQSELPILREMAENYDGPDQWHYRFIAESEDAALAYLPDGGYYKNLNRFEFEIPEHDAEALVKRMLLIEHMLIPYESAKKVA